MMATEQDAISDIGAAMIAEPFVDVVRFTPGGRSVAARESASAVSDRQPDPLSRREEPLLAADVDGLAGRVEVDRHRAAIAELALNRADADRSRLALDPPAARPAGQV